MMENKKHEILLGLTTTPKSDWRGKVEEMKKFGIKRIALFPTFLGLEQRKELYALLNEIEGLEIPHVHLRSEDIERWELELFLKKYKTEVFNIHEGAISVPQFGFILDKIYIENRFRVFSEEKLDSCAGICVDFSHMEEGRLNKRSRLNPIFELDDLIKKYKIGCCHVSAIKNNKWNPLNYFFGFDRHYLNNLREVDYMKKYVKYLPQYISLELENSFKDQLGVKRYMEKILNI